MRQRRLVRFVGLICMLVMFASLWPASPALALSGVFHNPYGSDDLYSTEATERSPRDPMAGDSVSLNVTTWPIEAGQTTWITWTGERRGPDADRRGLAVQQRQQHLLEDRHGPFVRGDSIQYTINADVNGTNQTSTGPFTFKVTSWSNVTNVTSYTNNSSSVDVTTGDSAGSFTPKIRFAFPTLDSFRLQLAPTGTGLNISGLTSYTVTSDATTLTISTTSLVLKIHENPLSAGGLQGRRHHADYAPVRPEARSTTWAGLAMAAARLHGSRITTHSGRRALRGFGERYDYLDQRGKDVNNYVYNQYQNQGTTHRTYLSVPFFTNSAGYGIYIPSTQYSLFNIGTYLTDMAAARQHQWRAEFNHGLLFLQRHAENILDRYTSVAGRPQRQVGVWPVDCRRMSGTRRPKSPTR